MVSPLSLLCAILLCLPLAIVFTITTTLGGPERLLFLPKNTPIGTLHQLHSTAADIPASQNPTLHYDIAPTEYRPATRPENSTRPHHQSFPSNGSSPVSPSLDDDVFLLGMAARRTESQPKPPKKLAFMFLTNSPLPFAPLWEIFFNASSSSTRLYNLYVHADPTRSYAPPFRGAFRSRVVPSKPTRRFTPTLAAAARRLLAYALLDDESNSHFALLSPSCVPIRPFSFVYNSLVSSPRSYIEILKDEAGAYDRYAARGEDAMLPEVRFEDFRIGSQFWVLTRRHARVVVSDSSVWSKFGIGCVSQSQTSCFPEENYFSTLLHVTDPRGCVPATLTHVNWTGSWDGHPQKYSRQEVVPELIERLRGSRPRYGDDGTNGSDAAVAERNDQFLFARKFSPACLKPLMEMANDVLFKD